jgi:hypothetical protein
MPKIRAGNITMNYDEQGSGEPLVLIPYRRRRSVAELQLGVVG